MSESYKYIDPDYTYTDPQTGILRNLADVTDENILLFIEGGASFKLPGTQLHQIATKPTTVIYLFSNIISKCI